MQDAARSAFGERREFVTRTCTLNINRGDAGKLQVEAGKAERNGGCCDFRPLCKHFI